ncbi:MAG: ABC transporter permease subunit [Trueperaceae bacterium]
MSAIARRDLLLVRQSKAVTIPLVVVPLILVVLIPVGVTLLARFGGEAAMASADVDQLLTRMPQPLMERLAPLEPAQQLVVLVLGYLFAPLFLVLPLMVSSVIAADTFAGEKERKTLEALLYTPTSDRELFLAKLAAAFVPAVAVAWIGLVAYSAVVDVAAYPLLGRLLLPDTLWLVMGIVVAPAVALLGLAVTVIVSARAESFQEAYQLGGVVVLPLVAMVAAQAAGLVYLSAWAALLGGLVLIAIDAGLITLGMRAFRRDAMAAGRPRARGNRRNVGGNGRGGTSRQPPGTEPETSVTDARDAPEAPDGVVAPDAPEAPDAVAAPDEHSPPAPADLDALVGQLLGAFSRGDGPSALYEAASDRMRSKVGGPVVFRRAFANELYAPLANPIEAQAEPFAFVGDTARTTICVHGADGQHASYVLAVAKAKHGERAGTWLVSGLVRDGVDL